MVPTTVRRAMAGTNVNRFFGTIFRFMRKDISFYSRCLSVCARSRPALLQLCRQEFYPEQQRNFMLPTLSKILLPKKELQYSETRILGYSMEQMYDVVSQVGKYDEFLPWCAKSTMSNKGQGLYECHLTIGFPPLYETYTSRVTVCRPHLVRSVSTDGKMFHHLDTTWKLGYGLPERPDTCTLDFSVSFAFRSRLHSHVAEIFLDEVTKKMVNSFLLRAEQQHGPQSVVVRGKKLSVEHTPKSRS